MKKYPVILLSTICLILLNLACDPCKDKECGPYAEGCDDGKCICKCGASIGSDNRCSVLDREVYLGQYTTSGQISGGGSISQFTLRCDAVPGEDNIDRMTIDLSSIGFPKFNGKHCNSNVEIDPYKDNMTNDEFTATVFRSGNILTLTVERKTISEKITYTFIGNKQQ